MSAESEFTSLLDPNAGLEALIEVSQISSYAFEGRCLTGARGRIFGGQVAAQAFRAASLLVTPEYKPDSSYSLFLRPGNPALPVLYKTTELKSGRSLSNFRIDALQKSEDGIETLILTALASFHIDEPGPNYQDAMPNTISAEECTKTDYIPPGSNPAVRAPIEFRWPDPLAISLEPTPARQQTWFKSKSSLSDDPSIHASALIYISDLTLTRTAHMPLRNLNSSNLGASLDHTLWFHRPFYAHDWMLFVQETTSLASARAISNGKLFSASGELIASASQEALIRHT